MKQAKISLREIYKRLCPKCKEKVINYVMEGMTKTAIMKSLEGKDEPEKEQ